MSLKANRQQVPDCEPYCRYRLSVRLFRGARRVPLPNRNDTADFGNDPYSIERPEYLLGDISALLRSSNRGQAPTYQS